MLLQFTPVCFRARGSKVEDANLPAKCLLLNSTLLLAVDNYRDAFESEHTPTLMIHIICMQTFSIPPSTMDDC